jgi:hypothetical protein
VFRYRIRVIDIVRIRHRARVWVRSRTRFRGKVRFKFRVICVRPMTKGKFRVSVSARVIFSFGPSTRFRIGLGIWLG